MASDTYAIDFGGARALSTQAGGWARAAHDSAAELVEALMLSDLPSDAGNLLDQIASDARIVAAAIGRALDKLESHAFSFERVQGLLANAEEIKLASGTQHPEWWTHEQHAHAADLEAEANQLLRDMGVDVDALRSAGHDSLGTLTPKELAAQFALSRAQGLFMTATGLQGDPFSAERDALLTEAQTIVDELYGTDTAARLSLGPKGLDPFALSLLSNYDKGADRDAAIVAASSDPLRVLDLISKGFTEQGALAFVESQGETGLATLSFIELEARLGYLASQGDINGRELSEVWRELNERAGQVPGGFDYHSVDLEALRHAEMAGVTFIQALATRIDRDYQAWVSKPGGDLPMPAELRADLELLVRVRYAKPAEEHEAAVAEAIATGAIGPLPPAPAGLTPELLAAEVASLKAMLRAGIALPVAEVLSATLRDATRAEISAFGTTLNSETASGATLEDALSVAMNGYALSLSARMRGMTESEYEIYTAFFSEDVFTALDGIIDGESNGQVSSKELWHVLDNYIALGYDQELVSLVGDFLGNETLMARLDSASVFNGGIVGADRYGRLKLDDQIWSMEDFRAFEGKQSMNFLLSGFVDQIDTAADGGDADGHLSKVDFKAFVDRADELGLSRTEVEALQYVIDGDLHDKHWHERHRDSIALALAIIASTALTVATIGAASSLMASVIIAAAAAGTGGAAAGLATVSINLLSDEDMWDGVARNTVTGTVTGGMTGFGIGSSAHSFAATGATPAARVAHALGLGSEISGAASFGAFDPFVAPLIGADEVDLANAHEMMGEISVGLEALSLKASLVDMATTGEIPDDLVWVVVNNGGGRSAGFDASRNLFSEDDRTPVFAPHIHGQPDLSEVLDLEGFNESADPDVEGFITELDFGPPNLELGDFDGPSEAIAGADD